MFQGFYPVKALFLITPEDFFLLRRNLKFMFFHCLHISDQRLKGIVLFHLYQIAALQLTVQIHGSIGRYLCSSLFQLFTVDLKIVLQLRKFPQLSIGNIQKTSVLQAEIFFPAVISGKNVKKLCLIHAFHIYIQIQKSG